jgi:hypothetical protein
MEVAPTTKFITRNFSGKQQLAKYASKQLTSSFHGKHEYSNPKSRKNFDNIWWQQLGTRKQS